MRVADNLDHGLNSLIVMRSDYTKKYRVLGIVVSAFYALS